MHGKFGVWIHSTLGFDAQFGPVELLGLSHKREVQLKRRFSQFWSDESGATAIEYGLIAAGISLAIIAAVNLLGGTLNTNFTSINSSLK
jgi:pilus assembly protein Flp/PilA